MPTLPRPMVEQHNAAVEVRDPHTGECIELSVGRWRQALPAILRACGIDLSAEVLEMGANARYAYISPHDHYADQLNRAAKALEGEQVSHDS